MPVVGGAYFEIYRQVKQRLEKEVPNIYILPVGAGAIGSLQPHKVIDSIIERDFDLFFVFNALNALLAKERIKKSGKSIPFLFTGIAYPKEYGIVDSLEHPGSYCTGVSHPFQDYKAYCDNFLKLVPQAKKILLLDQLSLLKSSDGAVDSRENSIRNIKNFYKNTISYFHKKNIDAILLSNTDEDLLFEEVSKQIECVDALLIPEGSRLVAWSNELSRICMEKNVVFYTGDIETVRDGYSHLAYGIDYSIVSEELAKVAVEVLMRKDRLSLPSVVILENTRFACVNKMLVEKNNNIVVPSDIKFFK